MKQILICLALTLAISAITLALAWCDSLWVICAVLGGSVLGAITSFGPYLRDRKVRALVVAAYDTDHISTLGTALVEVLGTPDVIEARRACLSREEAMWAKRYANGDASDF